MNFSNVCKEIRKQSKPGFGLKTIIHNKALNREADKVSAQFGAEFQRFMYLGGRQGNLQAAAGYVGYLVSLYAVLKKTAKTQANAEFEAFWDRAEKVLLNKAKEYASDKSRFHNFERASELCSQVESDILSPEQSIFGMAMKHIVSCEDLINQLVPSLGSARKPDDAKRIAAMLDEKFGDAVNYILLLTGYLVKDE